MLVPIIGTCCLHQCWPSYGCGRHYCVWSSLSGSRCWLRHCCWWSSVVVAGALCLECSRCRCPPRSRWISSSRASQPKRNGSAVWPTSNAGWTVCAACCRRSFQIGPDPAGRHVCGARIVERQRTTWCQGRVHLWRRQQSNLPKVGRRSTTPQPMCYL